MRRFSIHGGCWDSRFPASLLCRARCAPTAALHALWELHGKHNTVYILGSIHVLRPTDYPLRARGAACLRQRQVAVHGSQT